jgi:hypothetical protein
LLFTNIIFPVFKNKNNECPDYQHTSGIPKRSPHPLPPLLEERGIEVIDVITLYKPT